jgi:polyvinyl alcohol dehydrogenase (cytochrome)
MMNVRLLQGWLPGLLLCLAGSACGQTNYGQTHCDRAVDTQGARGSWGYGLSNHRYQHDSRITSSNVQNLKLAWVFKLDDDEDPHSFPLVTNDSVVVGSRSGLLHALDKRSGCLRWQYDADADIRTAIVAGTDGLIYFGTAGGEVVALNLADGSLAWRRKVHNHFAAMVTGSPTYYDGRLYVPVSSFEMFVAIVPVYPCCDFQGAVVVLDAKTGKYLWHKNTIDEAATQVGTRWFVIPQYAPSGVPVWSAPAIDTKLGQIVIGTGENYSAPASANSDSIMALSLKDGAVRWSRQFTANDTWNLSCETPLSANCPENQGPDFDFGAATILHTLPDGQNLVLAGQKSGMVYALNAEDGSEIWRYRTGRGGKFGGIHWGMAIDPRKNRLFVPISDRSSGWITNREMVGPARSGIVAVDIATGKELWHAPVTGGCDNREDCHDGISASLTSSVGLVWAGGLDGVLRVFDSATGESRWSFDTWGPLTAVNGLAEGGSMDVHGAYVDNTMVFVSSGYGSFDQKGGNAFVAFRLPKE